MLATSATRFFFLESRIVEVEKPVRTVRKWTSSYAFTSKVIGNDRQRPTNAAAESVRRHRVAGRWEREKKIRAFGTRFRLPKIIYERLKPV